MNAILRAALLCLFCSLPVATLAQETHQGRGLVCDTQAQVEKFLEVADQPTALQQVNADDPTACGVLPVVFIEGKEVSRITTKHGTFRVVSILVIAVITPNGPQRIPPMPQFTLVAVSKDREA